LRLLFTAGRARLAGGVAPGLFRSPTVAAATATAVAAAAAAAVSTPATTATATFAGGGFVHPDHAPHPFDVLQIVDGFLFGGVVCEFNKGETALAAGFTVEREGTLANLAVLPEEMQQVIAFRLERKVADVDGHE
jgi:hypothetical protein